VQEPVREAKNRTDRWILAGVVLLAALMRLARLGAAEFVHDEA
jgi:predicted membrane-bound mannosyltransferase